MRTLNVPNVTFYGIAAVAVALSVSQKTVRRLVAKGSLAAVRIGGSIRIGEHAIADYLASHQTKRPDEKIRPAKIPHPGSKVKTWFA